MHKVSNINLIHFAHITRLFCEALRISRCTCEKLEGYFARSCHLFCHSYNTRIIEKLEIVNGGKRETASADTIGQYLIDGVIVSFAANFVSYSDENSQFIEFIRPKNDLKRSTRARYCAVAATDWLVRLHQRYPPRTYQPSSLQSRLLLFNPSLPNGLTIFS